LDDKKFYLGIDFLDMVKAFLMHYANTMCIMEKGQPFVFLVKREIDEGKMLSALQLTEGIKKKDRIFLAALKLDKEAKKVQAPKVVQKVFNEIKDVMPAE